MALHTVNISSVVNVSLYVMLNSISFSSILSSLKKELSVFITRFELEPTRDLNIIINLHIIKYSSFPKSNCIYWSPSHSDLALNFDSFKGSLSSLLV